MEENLKRNGVLEGILLEELEHLRTGDRGFQSD